MPATKPDTIDQLYGLIANEEDARVCKDIPEEACREVPPRNFFLILFSNVLTKLGDLLISPPKTVLAWLMSAVGAPALVAWLVPIRESGSMVPQMVIAAWVRRKAVRKWFWTLGSFGQPSAWLRWRQACGFLKAMRPVAALSRRLLCFHWPGGDSARSP